MFGPSVCDEYFSNHIIHSHEDDLLVDKVMRSLQKSGLVHSAGMATSLTNLGQQWYFDISYTCFVYSFELNEFP